MKAPKEHVFVSAVVYTCNDEAIIENFLQRIDEILSNTYENFEIVLVNDYSTDSTLSKARSIAKELRGNVVIINLARRHGVEHAMMAGLNKSMGDFVYEFESTVIDYPLEIIPNLYKTATGGYDIVSAATTYVSRNSRWFYKLVNKFSYLDMDLSTERIRLVTRRALNNMLNLKEKVRYRKALYAFTGYARTRVTYTPSVKIQNKKFNRENIKTAFDVIVSFSNFGLKISHYLSFSFFAFSIFMLGYALYQFIFNKSVVEGWTTLMILISIGFSGVFFIFAVMGEYISRILIETQNRPTYSTRSVELFKEKKDNHIAEIELAEAEVAAGENN